jgi:pyruvate,orthophosphate dikinase
MGIERIEDDGNRTNADTPTDTKMAIMHGAEGIGLCRTAHMFFGGDKIISVRKMIPQQYQEARGLLAELLPMQRGDFEENSPH